MGRVRKPAPPRRRRPHFLYDAERRAAVCGYCLRYVYDRAVARAVAGRAPVEFVEGEAGR